MPDQCLELPFREYVDIRIKTLEENIKLKLDAIQAEYTKSEVAYPTKEQLDTAMKEYCPIKESDRLSRNIDILMSVIISIFLLFIAVYILK